MDLNGQTSTTLSGAHLSTPSEGPGEMGGDMPNLVMIQLPSDHTQRTTPESRWAARISASIDADSAHLCFLPTKPSSSFARHSRQMETSVIAILRSLRFISTGAYETRQSAATGEVVGSNPAMPTKGRYLAKSDDGRV